MGLQLAMSNIRLNQPVGMLGEYDATSPLSSCSRGINTDRLRQKFVASGNYNTRWRRSCNHSTTNPLPSSGLPNAADEGAIPAEGYAPWSTTTS